MFIQFLKINKIHSGSEPAVPEENKHLFMLAEYEKNWPKAGSEKTAYYSNVLPGEYVFKVKASSSYGIWAEKAIKITIMPPWWQTW